MGIDIESVLANSHSQLTQSTGVELPDLDPQTDPVYYCHMAQTTSSNMATTTGRLTRYWTSRAESAN